MKTIKVFDPSNCFGNYCPDPEENSMKCWHMVSRWVSLCARCFIVFAFLLGLSSGLLRAQAIVTTDLSPDFGYAATTVKRIDATQSIFVLGSNGNLWLEPGPYGKLPPPGRQQVDGNVGTFQAVDAKNVFVVGANGGVESFQALSAT